MCLMKSPQKTAHQKSNENKATFQSEFFVETSSYEVSDNESVDYQRVLYSCYKARSYPIFFVYNAPTNPLNPCSHPVIELIHSS